ncbi:MAG: GerMN domain-containing protein [Anaerostipes sp.]|nr:GerMN domain-containing protein [Anaerostipes sp.]
MISRMRWILLCFLAVILAFNATACSKKEAASKKETGTGIYYTNEKYIKLIHVDKKLDVKENGQLGAEELLDDMRKVNKKSNYRSAIPDKVVVNSVTVLNNVASVDFSTGYKKISNNQDLICRAAIVYTLTQLKAINYVEFSISGQSMLDTDGKAYGALNNDSFVFGNLPIDLQN